MICAAICEESVEAMVDTAEKLDCDIVELRLDYLVNATDLSLLSELEKPFISTCMPSWEGGKYAGSEEERISILEDSLEFADYATIELATKPALRDVFVEKAKEAGVKVIVAAHDFEKTPSPMEITEIIENEKLAGADVAKIAFTPKTSDDVLATLHPLVSGEDTPLIAISMGDAGRVTRILAPLLGSYLTYGFPDGKAAAAPGQFSIKELKNILGSL